VSPRAILLRDSRTRRLFQAVSSGAAARVFTGAISLLTLPLAVRYLGAERYGVWATVTTTAVWINLLDLGIANSLTNEISRAFAMGDKKAARRYFTNALALTSVFTASAGLLFACFGRQVNWSRLLNVSADVSLTEVRRTVFTAVALMLLALPCNLVNKLLAGYQELPRSFLANGLGSLGSLRDFLLVLHYESGCLFSMPCRWAA
jgi:Na+-driven multidrug efflux pump